MLPYRLNSALQLGSLDSLSGFLRSLTLNLSTSKSKLHRNCGVDTPAWSGRPNLPTILRLPFPTILAHSKPSRINTCKSASKQTALTPFRINTYEKTRGGGRGAIACVPTIPILESSAHHSSPATHHSPLYSSSFLSNSCALFCTLLRLAKTQLIYFQTLPHSWPKSTRGGGVPPQPQTRLGSGSLAVSFRLRSIRGALAKSPGVCYSGSCKMLHWETGPGNG